MNEPLLADAYRCLDLPADAPLLQVERAYRRKQALYGEGALATCGLVDAGAREALLERLDAAYRRIAADRSRACQPLAPAADGAAEEPEPAASPGRFLKARRQAAGLSLREVADRTKIGMMKLAQIEEERYAELPAPVYLRGFVVAFARALGLPEAHVIAGHFLERHRERVAEP